MKKKPIILIAAGVLVLLLAGGGFFAFRAFSGGKSSEKAEEKKEEHGEKKEVRAEEKHGAKENAGGEKDPKGGAEASVHSGMGPVFAMEPFTVNLADPGRPRYLKLVLQAEVEAPAAVDQLEGVKPKVRDSVLMLLCSKTAAEVTTVEGKETLRNEIIRRLNSFLSQAKVTEVYFTDFVVQ
ncbi:MAG: flagellar basal body-associated FliL family protein [Deltaproteobacteria bacterium]|nr:flagellar basal body-associated FliL family protein [Deltaproteobacteria bacterium]